MKEKLLEEIRDIAIQIRNWLYLETKYLKLTAAEKITIILGSLILGAVCFLLALIAIVVLSFCLVGVFEPLVGNALSYLIVAGIYLLLAVCVYFLRTPLIFNPICKLITKMFIDKE